MNTQNQVYVKPDELTFQWIRKVFFSHLRESKSLSLSFRQTQRAFVLLILLSASLVTNAVPYSLNDDIVTGNGLEWLQWDETVGMSIHDVLDDGALMSEGWRIASNVEIAQLLSVFFPSEDFGVTWDSLENTAQGTQVPWLVGEDSQTNLFISIFGDGFAAGGGSVGFPGDPLVVSSAFYGLDLDGDGGFNRVGVVDDYTVRAGDLRVGHIDTWIDGFANTFSHAQIGVALVRATSVPEPTSILLMLIGLMGLGFYRHS